MFWKNLFARKTLEMLDEEARGENRLHRILGKVGLTSLGVGAIIGAGIFVMTGRVAAQDAGPGILVSFIVAGFACALAALCYAEFASMAPVAGSAYTYAYATLGEIFAWIIGWDLILEYAMSAATVAASWSEYLNKLLHVLKFPEVPEWLCSDPTSGGIVNLPAVAILLACTVVLVIGIRESAMSNTIMVLIKLGVVLFVIAVGLAFVNGANWTSIPPEARILPEQKLIPKYALAQAESEGAEKEQLHIRSDALAYLAMMEYLERYRTELGSRGIDAKFIDGHRAAFAKHIGRKYENGFERIDRSLATRNEETKTEDAKVVAKLLANVKANRLEEVHKPWGMLAYLGVTDKLAQLDDATRTSFFPYGLSGVMLGASIVFFAFIGFDSISTHAEEAVNPAKDVPFSIIASLILCSGLYIAVSAVITGMVPYPYIDPKAALASAFSDNDQNMAAGLIALGGLAGMTSVLLITFLSQARIFLAMARDGLLPHSIFGVVHEKFKTPHVSTMLTGLLMCVVAGFTPITTLEEMVNIGTLFAFVVVCASVLLLRINRPEAPRPFRCPALFIVAPLGVAVNFLLMLFLPIETWIRLLVWLGLGLVIYFAFGYRYSVLRARNAKA